MPEEDISQIDASEWLRRFKANEQSTADDLYEAYATRLLALARTRLSAKMARRLDPEDILQSVFRSFFVGLRSERWADDEIDDLWRLLVGITLNKLGENVRFHQAAKRSSAREVAPDNEPSSSRNGDWLSREPSPADVVAAADELAWLLAKFSIEQRRAIELRLQRHTIEEIAKLTSCSDRTIRRWLEQARDLLESRVARLAEPRARSGSDGPCAIVLDKSVPAPLDHRDFQLERLIDSGGMCKVYAARQRTTNQSVCIKVMRKPQRHQRALIARFVNEARLVMQLSHPRIVPVHGLGRLPDGGYFMSMDLVEGKNLAAAHLSKSIGVTDGLAALAEIADALQYCHDEGIVHCDVQPRNILLSSGRAMLTDFGFARRIDAASPREPSDAFVAGTPGFMAPEQSEPARIGPATDVYGLGAVAYWLLTGQPPNQELATDSRLRVGDQAPGVVRSERLAFPADVPPQLRELCVRSLAPIPEERTITMGEMAAAFRALSA
jgi:RNA polymerase sigma factor (sigma-70 family)